MAHKIPLQPGDSTQGQSGLYENSTAADRRPSQTGSGSAPGENAAPSYGESETPLYRIGYLNPTAKHAPPYEAIYMEGDSSGAGTTIHEIDICSYGDAYDPTAPTRVRFVDNYSLDSDGDGHLN